MTSPAEKMRRLGFKNWAGRHRFIQDHATEILDDYKKLGWTKTQAKWHIGTTTIRKLQGFPPRAGVKPAKKRTGPAQPVSAKDFAHAILEDYSALKTENYQLKQQVKALRLEIHSYELAEKRRKQEDEESFRAKVQTALAEPGGNEL